ARRFIISQAEVPNARIIGAVKALTGNRLKYEMPSKTRSRVGGTGFSVSIKLSTAFWAWNHHACGAVNPLSASRPTKKNGEVGTAAHGYRLPNRITKRSSQTEERSELSQLINTG